MVDWRIYYSDGSTFDDSDGAPHDAPKTGVQVVLVKDGPKGRRVLKLQSWYVWSPLINRWCDLPDTGSVMTMALQVPYVVILNGEYIRENDFERILIAAYNDPDFPGISTPSHPAWSE